MPATLYYYFFWCAASESETKAPENHFRLKLVSTKFGVPFYRVHRMKRKIEALSARHVDENLRVRAAFLKTKQTLFK